MLAGSVFDDNAEKKHDGKRKNRFSLQKSRLLYIYAFDMCSPRECKIDGDRDDWVR